MTTLETEKQPLFPVEDDPTSSLDPSYSNKKSQDLPLKSEPDSLTRCPCPPLRQKVTGRCLCKLSIIFYLLVCVALSVLYVGLRYQHESDMELEDQPLPWIPGTPPLFHEKPKPILQVQKDLPYTEWIAKRWTYHDTPFADWPTLPSSVANITQIAQGTVGKSNGVWVLTETELFFAMNFPTKLNFLNVSETLELEVTAGSMVAVSVRGQVYLATSNNITLLDCSGEIEEYCEIVTFNTEPLPYTSVYSTAISLSTGALWLGTDKGLFYAVTHTPSPLSVPEEFYYDGDIVITNVSEVKGQVRTLLWRSGISADPRHSAFELVPGALNVRQSGLVSSTSQGVVSVDYQRKEESFGLLVVCTAERVYFYDGNNWWFEWVSVWGPGLGGVIDGPPTSMAVGSSGEIYIANNVSLTRINTNYTFDRIGPLQGLPYSQLNALCYVNFRPLYPDSTGGHSNNLYTPGVLWVGTGRGYALFDTESSKFKGYFYGPRWHSGEKIRAAASSDGKSVVLLTDKGLTFVIPEQWTLAEKAEHYQRMLARHTREPGLVSDCPLTNYAPSTCAPYTTDNDGLWTSWLVAAESLRYQVTKNISAKENAWALYKGMAFLNNVTGVHGLMARSVLRENSTIPGGVWHNSTTIPGWIWKGDTSSDEVAGHMFAYPFVYDMVAEDEEEKASVKELVDSIVGYIKENGYYLIDVTNQSTRWGVWAPSQINLNISWADEHGLNSLQILSYLLSAYRVTGKTEYWTAWKELAEQVDNHYGLNMINQKITFPRDDNFSDNELAFLPYFTYFHSLKMLREPVDNAVRVYGNLSLERTWRIVGKEKSSAWTAIYVYSRGYLNDPALIEQLVWNLRTWPLELVEWETINSHRLDIRRNPEQDRDYHSSSQSTEVLPANERGQLRWNANPYQLDSGGSSSEMDPGAWLMPYWLARWTGML